MVFLILILTAIIAVFVVLGVAIVDVLREIRDELRAWRGQSGD